MNKRNKALATGLLSLAVLGTAACTAPPAAAPAPIERAAETIPHIELLNGADSIKRVQHSMTDPAMQRIIADTETELRDAATEYGTTFEYERDILVCEQTYVTLDDPGAPNYFEDPTASALSECLNGTIASHDQMEAGE